MRLTPRLPAGWAEQRKPLGFAHHIQARLIQNPKLTVHDIAREEQVSAAYIYTLLRLPWLAPGITTAIINGRKP
ncbi:MAG: hypothetical protein WA648_16225, partial [Methylocella sp.]